MDQLVLYLLCLIDMNPRCAPMECPKPLLCHFFRGVMKRPKILTFKLAYHMKYMMLLPFSYNPFPKKDVTFLSFACVN